MKRSPPRSLLQTLLACGAFAAIGTASTAANAADTVFDSDPFAGASVNFNDNVRTVFAGNQRSVPTFEFKTDRFVFAGAAFPAIDNLYFAAGLGATLPATGANMIVVHDTSPTFNAGSAANVIADAVTVDGAGFFVYSNRGLGVNRLVYSTNLNLNTADLSVLARIESPSGPDALAAITSFDDHNFALAPVPEPASYALMLGGLAMLGVAARRRRG